MDLKELRLKHPKYLRKHRDQHNLMLVTDDECLCFSKQIQNYKVFLFAQDLQFLSVEAKNMKVYF